MNELFNNTFKAMRHELGQDRQRDTRPMWQRRLSTESVFCQSLVACGYMTAAQMHRAAQLYRLGMSRDGGVFFWQIDEHDKVSDGKIMYYRPDCHRDHDRHPSWVSYHLRRAAMLPLDCSPQHCLFGLHLLKTHTQPLCVVESEKTAVIMSAVRPEFTWLATGGKTELSVAKLLPLKGRRVMLFPDTDETGQTYRDWYEVAEAAADVLGHPVSVSSLLERQANQAQRAAKIDIADLLFSKPDSNIKPTKNI